MKRYLMLYDVNGSPKGFKDVSEHTPMELEHEMDFQSRFLKRFCVLSTDNPPQNPPAEELDDYDGSRLFVGVAWAALFSLVLFVVVWMVIGRFWG